MRDIEVGVNCLECNDELTIVKIDYEPRGVSITVEPCDNCIEVAQKQASEEGYEDGQESMEDTIYELRQEIEELNETIADLKQELVDKEK